ncbi:MAG: hypothetical protein ACXABY_33435, partial [Candidatus Thorarchaeota archaeon]
KPSDTWEEFLVDATTWTWTTETGSGYVKLKGDASFAPGNKVDVHIEWTLEDEDQLIEFKWKTTNDWKEFADVQQIIRNGQIEVNGATTDNWYRFYKTDDTLLDGQLPADVSYNNITDSLKNRYKLVGNSKDIDWRWDSTFDKNGTPTTSDVTVNCVNTNGKYGSNGYVEHVFNIGAVSKGQYVETIQHWHDAETIYLATLRNLEMDGVGVDRRLTTDSGNTVDSDHWGGMCYPSNASDRSSHVLNDGTDEVAIKFSGFRTLSKILIYVSAITSAGGTDLRARVVTDSAGDPSGTLGHANLTNTVELSSLSAGWNEITFTEGSLTAATSYWLRFDLENYSGSDTITFTTAYGASLSSLDTIDNDWFKDYKEYTGSWSATDQGECLVVLMYGASNAGYYNIMRYGTDGNMITGGATPGTGYYPPIKNDETTLYRTIVQIRPVDDVWKATKDLADEGIIDESSWGLSTVWAGFYEGPSAPDAKQFWDNQFGPDTEDSIYVCDQDTNQNEVLSEWNGITTNLDQETTDGPVVHSGDWVDTRIENYDASGNWEDTGPGLQIKEDRWGVWEFWFKVTDNFAADDEPEVKFYNLGGSGGVTLTGCRFSYLVVTADSSSSSSSESSSSSSSSSEIF